MERKFSFSGCEVGEMGIQIEKNGKAFYESVAAKSKNAKAKEVFEYLARQEEDHIKTFKKIFEDAKCVREPQGAYPDEYFAYMNALAGSYIFTQKDKGVEVAEKVTSDEEAIDLGIKLEKDSILLYEGMKEAVPEEDKSLVDRIIIEEKEHFRKLSELKEGEAR